MLVIEKKNLFEFNRISITCAVKTNICLCFKRSVITPNVLSIRGRNLSDNFHFQLEWIWCCCSLSIKPGWKAFSSGRHGDLIQLASGITWHRRKFETSLIRVLGENDFFLPSVQKKKVLTTTKKKVNPSNQIKAVLVCKWWTWRPVASLAYNSCFI